MSTFRKDCRWYLRYFSAPYCRREAFSSPTASLKKLDLGCDCDPAKDYQPQTWKRGLYPREPNDDVLEWEDED
jgi:hypothetical protein